MDKNHDIGTVEHGLTTLDARQPHPGLDPFRTFREAEAARAQLHAMARDLTRDEWVGVSWALNGTPPPKPLRPDLAALVATARKGGRL